MNSIRTALACTALLLAAPAAAQDEQEIVITGNRDIDQRVRSFVGALAPALPSDQIARFESPVCPGVLGLSDTQEAAIERRLREVAGAAGMTVQPQGCVINVLLVVTADKRHFIREVRRRHLRYLGNLSLNEIRRVANSPGPTAAWQQTRRVTANGLAINTDSGSGGDGGYVNRTTASPSRMTSASRPILDASMLVIERRAIAGLNTTQLADYAAMRLFARIDPERLAGVRAPTIATIIDAPAGAEVPLTLTPWDLGFLRGLYGSANNLYAGAQRAEIARQIGREIQQGE